jgi:hypothetical protein
VPRDIHFAADHESTRQRCVRILQAASQTCFCSLLEDISIEVALSRNLIAMQSLPTLNDVLAKLGMAVSKGLDAASLKAAGCSARQLRAAFDPAALRTAGFDIGNLRAAGFDTKLLKVAGFMASDFKAAGYDISSLLSADFTVKDLNCGFTAFEWKASGFSARQLHESEIYCSAADIRAAFGLDIAAFLKSGRHKSELKSAGFDLAQIKAAGINAEDIYRDFEVREFKQTGFKVSELKDTFDASELRMGGYSATELINDRHPDVIFVRPSQSSLPAPPHSPALSVTGQVVCLPLRTLIQSALVEVLFR